MKRAGDILAEVAAAVLRPRASPPPDVWCDRHLILPAVGTARPGRWRTSVTPYLRDPFRAFADPRVEEISFIKSAQVGLTAWWLGCVLYAAAELGVNTRTVYPTEAKGREINEERLVPLVDHCAPATALLGSSPRDIGVGQIRWRNGTRSAFAWSNSSTGLKGTATTPIWGLDELDEHEPGAAEKTRSRTTTWAGRRKICKFSTPMHAGVGIEAEYAAGDRRRWMVPCPRTGKYFELFDFRLIRWPHPEGKGGLGADPDAVEREAWLQSPFLEGREGRIYESEKAWMNAHGVWVPEGVEVESSGEILRTRPGGDGEGAVVVSEATEEDLRSGYLGVRLVGQPKRGAGHVSYRLNALASPFKAWGRLAAEFVRFRGDPPPDWVRENLAQAWQPRGERVETEALRRLCVRVADGGYRVGSVPADVLTVLCTIDVQKDHAWVKYTGFGERGRAVAYVGHARVAAAEGGDLVELDRWLDSRWETAGAGKGLELPVTACGIDHGHRPKEVERFAVRNARRGKAVHLVKGEGALDRTWGHKLGKSETGLPLIRVNSNFWKDYLVALVTGDRQFATAIDEELEQIDSGRWLLPEDCPEEYLRHLTAEHRVPAVERRMPTTAWVLRPGRKDNHLWDCDVYVLALADRLGVEVLTRAGVERAKAALAGGRRAEPAEGTEEREGGGRSGAARFGGGPRIARRFRR